MVRNGFLKMGEKWFRKIKNAMQYLANPFSSLGVKIKTSFPAF